MENNLGYHNAIIILTESVNAAKTRGDEGVYKAVELGSLEIANNVARIFSNGAGFNVEVYDTNTPGHYGFFITWDD